jgi:hypothetical protein
MSDMSSLSHEYASTTDFSHHVNQAVLLLKKKHLGGGDHYDVDKLAEASTLVAGIVLRLLRRLGAKPTDTSDTESTQKLPEDVLIRLEEKQGGNLEYFVEDLLKLQQSLANGSDLNSEEVQLLDSICEVADASASATFRKLWRR